MAICAGELFGFGKMICVSGVRDIFAFGRLDWCK